MNRCLRDRTLWLIHQGESEESRRAHLRRCPRCETRYQRLVQDLRVIDQTLRQTPPSLWVVRPARALRSRAFAVAAVLAAIVTLGGLEMWMWYQSLAWVQPRPDTNNVDAFLEEVSAVLSSPDNASGSAVAMLPPLDVDDLLEGQEREGEQDSPGGM